MKSILFPVAVMAIGCSAPTVAPPTQVDPPSDEILDVELYQVKFKVQPPVAPYPVEAKEARVDGNVTLSIVVDKEGRVVSATAISGPELLRSHAQDYYLKHLFYPYMKNGVPRVIRFNVLVPYRYKKWPTGW